MRALMSAFCWTYADYLCCGTNGHGWFRTIEVLSIYCLSFTQRITVELVNPRTNSCVFGMRDFASDSRLICKADAPCESHGVIHTFYVSSTKIYIYNQIKTA